MFSDIWWLDLWAFMAIMMTGFSLFFALLGLVFVAVGGRKEWHRGWTMVSLMGPAVGILFPLIVLVPFVAIYRIVRNV